MVGSLSIIIKMSNPSNIARSLPQPRHSPNHSTIPNAKLYFSNRYLFNVPSICLFLHATKFRQRPWKPTLTFRIVVESQRNYPTRAIREWFRKDYTNKKEREERKEGKTGGGTEKKKKGGGGNVRRLSNDRQLLPPFRAKVQRSEVKARRKNCHEWANRPRASSAHVYFTVYCAHALETNPRVYLHEGWRESGNLWMILCIASCRGSHRVIVTSWKPDTGHDPFCSSHSSVSRIGRCVLFDYAFILRILFEWRAKFYVYLYIATQWLKSGICNNVTRK